MTYWQLLETLMAKYLEHPEWAKLKVHVHEVEGDDKSISAEVLGKDIYITGSDE